VRAKGWIVREEDHVMVRMFDAAFLWTGLVVGVVVLAAGCQQKYWYQQSKTFDECKADHDVCWAELLRRTSLYHTTTYKSRFLENCMRQKGYGLVAEKDLPLEAKREEPAVPSDVPWVHAYGVAGAIPARPPSVPSDDGSTASAVTISWDPNQRTNRIPW
jgi:hypothetical protein